MTSIQIYGNATLDKNNIKTFPLEGVVLPWWEGHGTKEVSFKHLGKLIVAFHRRFNESLLVQFYKDNRKAGIVRFSFVPSVTSLDEMHVMISASTISDMSHFISGFLSAVEEDNGSD